MSCTICGQPITTTAHLCHLATDWIPTPSPPQPYKCPVCNGTGLVSTPGGVAGDFPTFISSSCGPWTCRVCTGQGVLWR